MSANETCEHLLNIAIYQWKQARDHLPTFAQPYFILLNFTSFYSTSTMFTMLALSYLMFVNIDNVDNVDNVDNDDNVVNVDNVDNVKSQKDYSVTDWLTDWLSNMDPRDACASNNK